MDMDMGKLQLNIYIRPLAICFTFRTIKNGIYEAIKTIKNHQPERIVIEVNGCPEIRFTLV